MRLLVITQDFAADASEVIVGGALKNPCYLVEQLQRRGHEIAVLSFDRFAHAADVAPAPRVHRYGSLLRLVPRTLWLNAKSTLRALREARRCDVIQSHHPSYVLQLSLLKRLGLVKAPLIVKAHGTGFPELHANEWGGLRGFLLRVNARIHLGLDRFALDVADKTISSSAFQTQEMTSLYGVPTERVVTIYNGYPEDRYARLARRTGDGPRRMLFVGRIVPKKGVDYFVELARAVARRTDVKAVMVLGHSRAIEDPALYRRVVEPLLQDPAFEVRFDVPEAEMPRIYAGCDVLVVPSRGYESVPTVVYEGHAAGLAVFATRKWGIAEVVKPEFGLSGELDDDAAAIATYLAAPRSSAAAPPSQAYRSQDFRWDALARKFEALYDELTQRGARSGSA